MAILDVYFIVYSFMLLLAHLQMFYHNANTDECYRTLLCLDDKNHIWRNTVLSALPLRRNLLVAGYTHPAPNHKYTIRGILFRIAFYVLESFLIIDSSHYSAPASCVTVIVCGNARGVPHQDRRKGIPRAVHSMKLALV